jgi:hypothetical protein
MKNKIYYRFLSEKDKYSIGFVTTDMSIGDIQKLTEKRRNMQKAPEKYDLIFYDENNIEITDDNYKVKPHKVLVIKRMPSYKRNHQFLDKIHEPSDIPFNKFNEFNYISCNRFTFVNASEPLEKILPKLTQDILDNKFKCSVCKRKEETTTTTTAVTASYTYKPVITLCCNETICEQCASNDDTLCVVCKRSKCGYIPNNAEYELKEKLYQIYKKAQEEKAKQLQQLQYTTSHQVDTSTNGVINLNINSNSNNNNSHLLGGNNIINNNVIGVNTQRPNLNVNKINHQNNNSSQIAIVQNPSYPLFQGARFFIIKSSNKENIEISQKHSEWATTQANQKKLNEAFQKNNVILIFSANRTSCYQGYAIMKTFISEKESTIWQNENNVRLGGSFGVYWLCCCEMPFSKVKNLTNQFTGEVVTKSRDTQELPNDLGYELINLCYEQERNEASSKPPKNITKDVVDSILLEIKQSREKQLQLQNNRIAAVNIQSIPIRPIVPANGTPMFNSYIMQGNPYFYGRMMMNPMQFQQQMMQQQQQMNLINNNNNNNNMSMNNK